MVGQVIQIEDFKDKIFITKSERNYTNNQIKIETYKRNFNDFISNLYKKILILNKYRKINQNIISFGCSFNCSAKKIINFPFLIPSKFKLDKINIYYNCDKFQYNKINTTPINININSSGNGNDFFFNSQSVFLNSSGNENSENTDWQFFFLSRKSIAGTLNSGGAGSGQSFGVNKFDTIESSFEYIYRENYWDNLEERTKTLLEWEQYYRGTIDHDYSGYISTPNSYHQHIYNFASENHQHFLQPTAHFHYYQIPQHNHNYPQHTHLFSTPNHSHEINFSHSHEVENEFYQSANIGNISIKINNNLIVDKKINGEVEFENYINNGINILSFICSGKCFLNFTITATGRITI